MSIKIRLASVLVALIAFGSTRAFAADGPWPLEKAQAWGKDTPWLVGCNFAPSNAINQLEMFQADTFDLATIDRELGWAEDLGFNTVRVFLHNLLWDQDRDGFLKRLDQFLGVAEKHKIRVMFVLFDAVWDPFPKVGKQREPQPHLHNSGWVQSPGLDILKDPKRHDELEGYVKGVVTKFRDDRRVVVWDLFNEPDNMNRPSYDKFEPTNKPFLALELLKKVFHWAREAKPSQPLTSGVWLGDWSEDKLSPMNRYQLEQSDIITFHDYSKLEKLKTQVTHLRRYKRPILCTEYMARPNGSTFDSILGYFKEEKIGAYNWGFVAGKTQTIYPWDSWTKTYTKEPNLWFHDIFRADGSVYDRREVDYIKKVTGKSKP